MIYLDLLLSFIEIGLLSIGGGYAAIPLIQSEVVDHHAWLTMSQFADIATIAEMTPGPIAINSATFVGIKVAGLPGALVASLGCILPSSCIIFCLAYLYYKYRELSLVGGILSGLRPAVVAMIASAALSIMALAFCQVSSFLQLKQPIKVDFVAVSIFLVAFLILRIKKPDPIKVMLGSGLAGLILYSIL